MKLCCLFTSSRAVPTDWTTSVKISITPVVLLTATPIRSPTISPAESAKSPTASTASSPASATASTTSPAPSTTSSATSETSSATSSITSLTASAVSSTASATTSTTSSWRPSISNALFCRSLYSLIASNFRMAVLNSAWYCLLRSFSLASDTFLLRENSY